MATTVILSLSQHVLGYGQEIWTSMLLVTSEWNSKGGQSAIVITVSIINDNASFSSAQDSILKICLLMHS